MKKHLILIILGLTYSLAIVWGQSQTDTTRGVIMPAKIENGDTIILANLEEMSIPTYTPPSFENKKEAQRYWTLVYNLRKVYPYAKMAREKLTEMNEHFKTLRTEKEKKEYTKQVEREIREQFEERLKNLTRTQGALLIKLIDRETGRTSYELVKEFRGNFSAFFWQTLARLFGQNLKNKYDPAGTDKPIEEIITAIEAGAI